MHHYKIRLKTGFETGFSAVTATATSALSSNQPWAQCYKSFYERNFCKKQEFLPLSGLSILV
jgi:hypothetical protein